MTTEPPWEPIQASLACLIQAIGASTLTAKILAAAAGSGLSGLEFLRAIGDGKLPPAPIAALMGFRPVEVEPGRVVFEGTPDESVYNPMRAVGTVVKPGRRVAFSSAEIALQQLPGEIKDVDAELGLDTSSSSS